jgi:SSS family solute:Na+ symporter
LGGLFLQLSYFGTDQSQVQRYLTGESITESRMGLLLNGMVKIPMQFFILFIGAMVFVFYQFVAPPIFFNSVETDKILASEHAPQFQALEQQYGNIFAEKKALVRDMVSAIRVGDELDINSAAENLNSLQAQANTVKSQAIELMQEHDPGMDPKDTNYIFLSFVTHYLPVGLVGLVIAAIIAASMSSTSGELNALASTSVVDIYRRIFKKNGSEQHYVIASKISTVIWGAYAIFLAEFASRLGSLIEAVNILGSLFYGTILGVFLVAFYIKRIGGTATFLGALIAEAAVVYCFFFTDITFLWYNVIGCFGVILGAALLSPFFNKHRGARSSQV